MANALSRADGVSIGGLHHHAGTGRPGSWPSVPPELTEVLPLGPVTFNWSTM
ncbi:hypothetical protein ACIBCO_18430 [Streptomyces violascens]|uniref:hypothetical protein n=1 Tax=Streptomyces violascens TaxID=67381 RepID=UPI0037A10E58